MAESIVVDAAPITADKGADQQQERRLWLMEIRDEHAHDFVVIAGGNDDLRTGVQGVKFIATEPVDDGLQGFHSSGC